jgi:hypothetical protein
VSEEEHEKQIGTEGKVDHVEVKPGPTSPVPEFGRRSVRAGRRCGGASGLESKKGEERRKM